MDARLCGEIAHSLQKKNRTEITSSIRLCFDTFFSRIISISIIVVVVVLYTNHINILFSISFHLNLFFFRVRCTLIYNVVRSIEKQFLFFFLVCRCYFFFSSLIFSMLLLFFLSHIFDVTLKEKSIQREKNAHKNGYNTKSFSEVNKTITTYFEINFRLSVSLLFLLLLVVSLSYAWIH